MAETWSICKRQANCVACERPFVAGETLFSVLRFTEEDLLQRGDYCSACFEQRPESSEDLFFWRTAHQESRRALRIDFETVLAILAQLQGENRPERLDFRFLLALLLVRHRRLRLVRVRGGTGREWLILRKPRTQKEFEVEVRDLEGGRRERLAEVLSGLFDPTAEADLDQLLAAAASSPSGASEASPLPGEGSGEGPPGP